ncbi:hypothetical protein H5410_049295 [Solanum commersonii]|uniref:Uncharacterized protein n=1 Tax=Solanum commersonii TaxID=4109 RepID=A0A9J5XLX7_SOLCO|nr:hypothetical protein H5410_049295 [Solanum commersonii]
MVYQRLGKSIFSELGTIYHQTLSGQKGKDQMKPGEELLLNGWENQTQKVWPKRKHNNKHAPKAKWSKMQTRGLGGS